MSTLAELRTLVLDRMNASSNDQMFEPARIDRTLNQALAALGREADWPWLVAVDTITWPVDTASLDLTTVLTNFRTIKHLRHETRALQTVSPKEFANYTERTGEYPMVYSIVNTTVYLAPYPTAAEQDIDIIYVRDEAVLASDNSEPLLPAAYNELLVLATCKPLSVAAKDGERYQLVHKEYIEKLQQAKDDVRRSRDLLQITHDESLWRFI